MLFIIILSIILVASVIATVVGVKKNKDIPYVGIIGDCISGVGLLVCIIMIVSVNSPSSHYAARVETEEFIAEMAISKKTIENIADDYARSVAIQEYNTKVSNYRSSILTIQHYLKSPWLNWFNNAEYANFSVDDVSYITTY